MGQFLDIDVLNYSIKSLSKMIDITFLKKKQLFDVTPESYRLFDSVTDDPNDKLTVVANNVKPVTGQVTSDTVRAVTKNPAVYQVGAEVIHIDEVLVPKFDSIKGVTTSDLTSIKADTQDNRYTKYNSNVLFIVDDTSMEFYDRDADTFTTISSGSAELEDDVTAIGVSIGSVNDGDTLLKGMSFTDFAKKILQKRIAPTYTAPSVSLKTNAKSVLERGTSATIVITPTFTQNDAGAVTGYELFRNGVSIYTDTTVSVYTDSITNLSGTYIQYTCKVTYADGAIKNDNMGDPDATGQILSGSITGTASKINIALKYYYGNSANNTISSLSSLTGVLDTKKDWHLSYTANDEYLILAYDSSYGDLSKIYDQNKFDNTSSWTTTTLTSGAFTYNVYVTNNKVTCSDFSYDFKF